MRYTTCLPCKNFGYLHLMTPPHPLDGIENMNFETYSPRHFFWYTTCIPYHSFALHFCTWWPRPTRIPQIWQLRPTLQDLSYHMQHCLPSKNFGFLHLMNPPHTFDGFENIIFFEFWNVLVKTFLLIYDMPVFEFLYLMNTPHTGVLKIWKLKHTHQYLLYDMISKNFGFLYLMTPPHSLEWVLKHEFWNVLVKTFHLIYDMPTLS